MSYLCPCERYFKPCPVCNFKEGLDLSMTQKQRVFKELGWGPESAILVALFLSLLPATVRRILGELKREGKVRKNPNGEWGLVK